MSSLEIHPRSIWTCLAFFSVYFDSRAYHGLWNWAMNWNFPFLFVPFVLQFDVERRDTDTRIDICCATKPGLLLSTVNTLEVLGLDLQQCVISCFNDFSMQASCSEVYVIDSIWSCLMLFCSNQSPISSNFWRYIISPLFLTGKRSKSTVELRRHKTSVVQKCWIWRKMPLDREAAKRKTRKKEKRRNGKWGLDFPLFSYLVLDWIGLEDQFLFSSTLSGLIMC